MGFLQNKFDLEEGEKVTGGQIGEICRCFKVAMFLSVRKDEYLGLCNQEHYHGGVSMHGLPKGSIFCHILISQGTK